MENTRIPAPQAHYNHTIECQLRFNDIDMFGHVNNSVYLQFFDLAKLKYFQDVTLAKPQADSLAMVVVNINCDFYAPSLIDEALEVKTAVIAIGHRSLTLEQRIINPHTGSVKCQAHTIMAGFNIATAESVPIPTDARKAIEEYEHRTFGC